MAAIVPGMVPRRRLAALTTALFLAAAAPAGAQGAGDEQYEDPFSGQDEQEQEEPAPAPEPAAPEAAPAPEPAAPEAAPAPAAETADPTQPATAQPAQLPVTGAETGLVALAGTVLLAGGVALRVRLRDQR
jgi:hypothetical protein